jgi:sarcosine oxidase
MRFDVAVVGLGGMGSAALAHCAARGASVVGIEQFGIAHDLGSSHGKSRMIRKAYFENPAYVPLILRAYDLWRELERESGEELLRLTGVLAVGQEDSKIVERTRHTATLHGLPLEQLSRREIEARYPTLKLLRPKSASSNPMAAFWIRSAPSLRMCEWQSSGRRDAMRRRDAKAGIPTSDGFEIQLSDGSRVEARALMLTIGPWFKSMLESLGVAVDVQRNVQVWFEPEHDAYTAGAFHQFPARSAGASRAALRIPDFGCGLKQPSTAAAT